MNQRRWEAETDVTKLALKLSEETGEVAKAILANDDYEALVELGHVRIVRNRLEEVLRSG